MSGLPLNTLSTAAYIIYLRKSRADNQDESVEEVLAKHEKMLQELALKELGFKIPEENIFREVMSGETIEERPEINKILEMISNPAIKAVLVVEPQRLSRGDLEDCGRIVNAFRYSKTKVITLQMTYDLTNKMHRKFFEQELLRGNDFLEYTKEILQRGRIASVQRGNFLGNNPPFGYDRAVIDDGPSLKPNEYADYVRLIFDMYVNNNESYGAIARHLTEIGVAPVRSDHWKPCTIRQILLNIHYIGYVKYGETTTTRTYENGKTVKRRSVLAENADEVTIAKGKHKAIISKELFEAAQARANKGPRVKRAETIKNPLAGLLYCKVCKKVMNRREYKNAKTRFACPDVSKCGMRSTTKDEIMAALIFALQHESLPDLETKLKNGDGNARSIQQKQLKALQRQLDELKKQEANQYVLLEKEIYTPEIFAMRNQEVRAEMQTVREQIYNLNRVIPKEIDYGERIVKLKDAINGLQDDELSVLEQNLLLKSIIDRIDYEFISREGKGNIKFRLHIKLLV